MSEPLKYAEVFAELEAMMAASQDGPEGFTVSDLAAHLGLGHRGAGHKVTEWATAGLIECVGKRRVTNAAKRASVIPVYRPCRPSG